MIIVVAGLVLMAIEAIVVVGFIRIADRLSPVERR